MATLHGRVTLVAGATRGAGRGIAVELGAEGATVYCTGRSSRTDAGRAAGGAPHDLTRRPETIEETAERVTAAGGDGRARVLDHLDAEAVEALAAEVAEQHGALDLLVVNVWGCEHLIDAGKLWELEPSRGLETVERVLRTHFLTLRHFLPAMVARGAGLVIEITDGAFAGYRGHATYDLAKLIPRRLAYALRCDLAGTTSELTVLSLTPGFLRSEAMLEGFGVREENWRDAIAKDPYFAASESPGYVGRAVAALAADPEVRRFDGSAQSSWELARVYGFTDRDGRQPHWDEHFDAEIEKLLAKDAPDEGERGLLRARYWQLHLDPARAGLTERIARKLGSGGPG